MIIGCLSWYDESPSWLASCVASIATLCDWLVAADGAFDMYPDGAARSTSPQGAVVRETAAELGLGLVLIEPREVWAGNAQVRKRNAIFSHAALIGEIGEDWLLVVDADELVRANRAEVLDRLEAIPYGDPETQDTADCAEVTIRTYPDPHGSAEIERAMKHTPSPPKWAGADRRLFRLTETGPLCLGGHFRIGVPGAERMYRDNRAAGALAPALNLNRELELEHRGPHRILDRRNRSATYYDRRTRHQVER